MPTVHTVLGPVDTADLGFTLSHEHVGTNAAGLRHTYPEFIDREGLLEQSVAAMREAYQEGVRTSVQACPSLPIRGRPTASESSKSVSLRKRVWWKTRVGSSKGAEEDEDELRRPVHQTL